MENRHDAMPGLATAALALAAASAGRRAGLLDAIGGALDGARQQLPQRAAADAGIDAGIALRQHDTLRGWVQALADALRGDELAALCPDGPRTVPLGPVASVGPHATAYGLAGIHAMAALAAGCPVLAATGTPPDSTLQLNDLIGGAVAACGLPSGVFTLVPDAAAGLLGRHALRGAISRDGASHGTLHGPICAGMTLVAEADGREVAFILPGALNGHAEYLGQQLASLAGPDALVAAIDGDGYVDLREALVERPGTAPFEEMTASAIIAAPLLARRRPGGLLVRCADAGELAALAGVLGPQASASLHVQGPDAALAAGLLPALELMARHLHFNRFGAALLPTASGARDAIGRFRRPVFHHPA